MKNLKLLWVGLIAVSVMACSSDGDDAQPDNGSTIDVQELRNLTSNGTWRITNYVEDGEDETYNFNDYSFTFSPDGTVTAVNGDTSITGTWNITEDDDDDDDNSSDIDFVLNFNVDDDSIFDELEEDWDIDSYTSNKISLLDDDDDDDLDILVFERN